jgi:hypothetical protein
MEAKSTAASFDLLKVENSDDIPTLDISRWNSALQTQLYLSLLR